MYPMRKIVSAQKRKSRDRNPTGQAIVSLLATNGLKNKWEIKNDLHKSYGNVYTAIQTLLKQDLVQVKEKRPSAKNPDPQVEYYTLTLRGLFAYFAHTPNSWRQLEAVIANFPDMLLTFKKWPLFVRAGLKDQMLSLVKSSIEVNFADFRIVYRKEFPFKSVFNPMEKVRELIDSGILYVNTLLPKNKLLARVCKQDSELRRFVEAQLDGEIQEAEKTRLRLQVWREWWKNLA